jgi:hypothetical protein
LTNVTKLGRHGHSYVVSTWSPNNEHEQKILESLQEGGVNLIHSAPPFEFDPDHRYKQHYGVFKGAQTLLHQCSDITHFVKIRTDMLMPETFWEWVYEVAGRDNKRLYVSQLMRRPFYMGDFVYLAEKAVFLSFLTDVLDYKSHAIHPSISFDVGIKYCESRNKAAGYGLGACRRVRFLFDFLFRLAAIKNRWNHFISKSIGVLPEEIWQDIKWRDRRVGSFLDSLKFKFDNFQVDTDVAFLENARSLVRDYMIYWTKCRSHRILTTCYFF